MTEGIPEGLNVEGPLFEVIAGRMVSISEVTHALWSAQGKEGAADEEEDEDVFERSEGEEGNVLEVSLQFGWSRRFPSIQLCPSSLLRREESMKFGVASVLLASEPR